MYMFPWRSIDFRNSFYLSVSTIFKILFRRFYSPGSDPPHKIMRYWVYYSTQLFCLFPTKKQTNKQNLMTEICHQKQSNTQMICIGCVPGLKGISAGSDLKYFTWFIVSDHFHLRVDLNPRISKIFASWMSVWNISANYVLVPLKFNLNWNIW